MDIFVGYTRRLSVATAHTKVFKSNRSQAVRLPKDVALPEYITKVDIVAIGNKRIITPAGSSWDDWFDGPQVSDDFMLERDQPADQERESF
jgi:antitoxin VapB